MAQQGQHSMPSVKSSARMQSFFNQSQDSLSESLIPRKVCGMRDRACTRVRICVLVFV